MLFRSFKQILYNLLSNAVKFTPEGGSISLTALGRRDRIAIIVSDSGVGIASEDQEAIFDKFFQSGATTRGVREGTGLGLAITQQLVEQQGGRIWVDSQLGRGSRFTFTVRSSSTPEAKPLVVIAGAEPQSAELLVNYLEPKGYATALASNASRAAMLVSELRPAALVLDLMGPAGESWNALRGLPDTPPIIVVSVVDEDELSRSLGAAAHLTKPVSKGLLTETLRLHGAGAGGKTVLVVDDEGAARELIVETLREAGYIAIAVSSGGEALTALADSIPAAVVLDLLMPGMSGIELLTRIKRSPRLEAIPVIVLTGMEIGMEDAQLLRQAAKALPPKGSAWKEHLLKELRQVVSSSV